MDTSRTTTTGPRTPMGLAGRRAHIRVPCALDTTFVVEATGQTGAARCLNIGLGGLRIECPFEITAPTNVQVCLQPPTGDPIEVTTRVIWTVTDCIDGPFPTGLSFQNLDDTTRQRIHELVGNLTP